MTEHEYDDDPLDWFDWPDLGRGFVEALAELSEIPNDRGQREVVAREAGALIESLAEAVGWDSAAEFLEAMAKRARRVRPRGRPRGTRLDPQLLVDYDNRPEGETLNAFAERAAAQSAILVEAGAIRKRVNTLMAAREASECLL